jgi:hypothetical protein
MKPGYDSRPRMPAPTPNREAVRLCRVASVCGEKSVSVTEYTTREGQVGG